MLTHSIRDTLARVSPLPFGIRIRAYPTRHLSGMWYHSVPAVGAPLYLWNLHYWKHSSGDYNLLDCLSKTIKEITAQIWSLSGFRSPFQWRVLKCQHRHWNGRNLRRLCGITITVSWGHLADVLETNLFNLRLRRFVSRQRNKNGGHWRAKSCTFRSFTIADFQARCQNALPRMSAGGGGCSPLSTPSVLGENSLGFERILPRMIMVCSSSCLYIFFNFHLWNYRRNYMFFFSGAAAKEEHM